MRLAGLVVDDTGLPIHGAEVTCWDNDGGKHGFDRALLGATCTVGGSFALEILPTRCARAVFAAPGCATREWRPQGPRDRGQAGLRIILPRLATLDVTVLLPDGWAAGGADVRLHLILELATGSRADALGRASFTLDPSGSLTLTATMYPYPGCPCLVSRPEFLRGRLLAGGRTDIVLLLEETLPATLEVIVVDAAENHLVEIDGADAAEPHRGIVRREVRTGCHRIRLVDRQGDVLAERHLWIPSGASIQREVLSPP